MKIQTKTTILFTILTATIFLILNVAVYFFINSFAQNDFSKRVELRAKISAKFRFEHADPSTQAFREIQRQYLEKLPGEEAFILNLDSNTKKILSPVPKQLPPDFLQQIIQNDGATAFYQSRFRHFAGLLYKGAEGHHIVIKSATNQYGSDMMRHLLVIKLVTLFCAVVLIYSVGLYFSKKTFKPIRDITNRAKQISENNLHLRLGEEEGTDEIAELTSTFNEMLSRLETAFETQNNFISNASHELRTPLTAIVGEADYALSKERSAEVYKQSLQQIIVQAEKLQELIKGLLSLAKTGFDGKKQKWETIRIDQLLYDVKDNCAAILPDNQLQVVLGNLPAEESGISIKGNYELLAMAIGNIAINACKYSGNKPVQLQLMLQQKIAEIQITDNGIGIPAGELKNIYDPFFRASNVSEYEGYGIGLPLSKNIIRLHKGSIIVLSTVNVGTTVKITLPLV
jgi:signal transduction histidine kinase